MIHIYHGDGKGKTTAAAGLALRAAGAGMKVCFLQFFKDGSSSEVGMLRKIPSVTVRIPDVYHGRYKKMNDSEKEETAACYRAFLRDAVSEARDYDLIVLDEILSVYRYGLIDRDELKGFLRSEGEKREIVLTGRDPAPELLEAADYVTEMKKEKHPFDRGIGARKGIEF